MSPRMILEKMVMRKQYADMKIGEDVRMCCYADVRIKIVFAQQNSRTLKSATQRKFNCCTSVGHILAVILKNVFQI